MAIASINPANGEVLARFPPATPDQLEAAVAGAAAQATRWRRVPVAERCRLLARAGEVLLARRDALARTMTLEMGKPIQAARAEVEKCAWVCRHYAEHAAADLADEPVPTDARQSFVRYQPLGVVLAVMPWNFPLWQVFRFAAPALAAGNVGLLKHASNVPQSALAIAEVFAEAGLPAGCFATLLVGSEAVGPLIADPRIAAVTLTGSEGAGVAVGEAAGRSLKKVVLELGGSDPFVVLPSADLDAAVATAVAARCINNGQSCIAAKRFVVHAAVYDRFVGAMVERMQALRMGDPLDPATDLGPLATPAIRQELAEQVAASVALGARVLCGGVVPGGPGNFYPPTVLVEAPPASPARRDELFGPVAVVVRVADLDEAIAVANETSLGLGAAVFTRDEHEIARACEEIEAGSVFVNGMVKSDPRLPFGGIKRSGHGRELARHGLREFVNAKTVWVG
jgi:succinate-semialdehyde dehydrogenase/glutarate-semialdehyde dehydrogenase